MNEFDKVIEKRNLLLDKIDDLLKNENPTEEQLKEIEDGQAEAETLLNQANEIKARHEKATAAADKQKQLRAIRLNPIVNRIVQSGGTATAHVGGTEKFRLPSNVQRVKLTNFQPEPSAEDRSPEERAYRFGMWALATATMKNMAHCYKAVNYCLDEGLLNVHGEGGTDVSGAGIFVPEEFMGDMIWLVERYGVARQLFRVVNMTSDTLTRPRRVGGLTAYAVGENAAGTESDAEWNEVRLTAKKWMVLTRMSSELAEDSVLAIANELIREIAQAFANKEDDCCFNGTGTSSYHGIQGVRTKLDALTAGTAPGLILGAGNAYSELTLANFQSVVGALPQYADTGSAGWVCHKTFAHTTMMRLALAAGGVTSTEIFNGVPRMVFLGYPVYVSQIMPSTEANSQIPVLFGDFAMGAMFGDRRRVTIDYSTEATVGGQSMWERDQIGVKATERFDFVAHDVGTNSAAGPIVGLELAGS